MTDENIAARLLERGHGSCQHGDQIDGPKEDCRLCLVDLAAQRIEWLEAQLGLVYSHVTFDRLSKPYAFEDVRSVLDDCWDQGINEEIQTRIKLGMLTER